MSDTDLHRSDRAKTRLPTGYRLGSSGAKPVTDSEVITAGGGGTYSTPRDMARYLAALLGGGANEHGSVLKPETLATMYAPHYQPDPRVPGIGLASSRVNLDGHLAVEHGGIIPGFNCQIFATPDDGVAVMAHTNGARNAMLWLPGELAGLLRQLLGVSAERLRTDIPHHPEIWGDICGWYRLDAGLTDARARLTIGAGAEVFVRGGQLMLRGLSPVPAVYRGFPLQPDDNDDPYMFRIDLSELGIDTGHIVFSQQPGRGTTALHIDFFPPSLLKRPATTNPRRWVTGALGTSQWPPQQQLFDGEAGNKKGSVPMSVAATDLWRMSATELAAAIRSRQTSSQEVIESHLQRIEAVNPSINAVTVILGEQALVAAKAADRTVASGGDLPPLHGVPFTVKENIDLVGTPTTVGLKALASAYPRKDAPIVERMRAAGAIPIGRTNCPNFTVRWHTDSELWGATVNPWDRSRTPGASSGGEAAALATGMTPWDSAAMGSDRCAGLPSAVESACSSQPLAVSRMQALSSRWMRRSASS
jgi:hypothetical protein